MSNYRGPFEEKMGILKRLTFFFSDPVFAAEENSEGDSENTESSSDTSSSTVNIEDLLSKVRQQEKEKHYKTIDKLKVQVKTLTEQHNEDLLKVADLENKLADAEKKVSEANKDDSSAVVTLKEELSKIQSEKKELEEKIKAFETAEIPSREDIEKEVREELSKEYEVRTYKAEKLAELKDEILVPELVMGDTKEEIDKSIEAAKKRSDEIRKSLGAKKSPARKSNPSNPDTSNVHESQVDLNEIATMDVGSKEYRELRKKLGLS